MRPNREHHEVFAMPLPVLTPAGTQALDTQLKSLVDSKTVPATFYGATNAKGTIYENQDGLRVFGDESKGVVDDKTILQLYSMTKLVTALSVMILLDKGQVDLDDEFFVEKHCPELALEKLKILTGFDEDEPILRPATRRITLRMLMTHTAGIMTYGSNPLAEKWYSLNKPAHAEQSHASIKSITRPLLYDPGSSWAYSLAMEWVGVLITRISGLSLEEFFKQHIFSKIPGGMPDTSFYPPLDLNERMMQACTRAADGSIKALSYGNTSLDKIQRPTKPSEVSDFLSGGAGLWGTMKDYLALLRLVLASDPKYDSIRSEVGPPLLSASSYGLLFQPSLKTPEAHKQLSEFMLKEQWPKPTPTPENVSHSIAMYLNLEDSELGRKKGSGSWLGAAKTNFWIDPESGVAGVCGTQLWSKNPDVWNEAYNDFEKTLYENLVEGDKSHL